MSYNDVSYEWTKKGCTLSDKTAFKEFGLTQNDIIKAINEGKLQFSQVGQAPPTKTWTIGVGPT